MKKFTLIEQDRYIAVDGQGIWFTEDKWPFIDIEHLWAIQWKDDGTEEGIGDVEYDSGSVQNTPATRSLIQRYVDHWQEEYDRQAEEKRFAEEKEKMDSLSWSEAMKELEEQLEDMEKRHQQTLHAARWEDEEVYKKLQEQMEDMQERHQLSIQAIVEDHEMQMETVHKNVAQQHEELFYGQDFVENNQESSQYESTGFDNITLFDGTVDESLFDDVVEESHFAESSLELEDEVIEEENEESVFTVSEIDLDVLDSEFNLELLFEEDIDEQVVSEIESLIEEEETPES